MTYKTRLDLTGQTYGFLQAMEFKGKTPNNQAIWLFRCLAPDCGKVIELPAHQARHGNNKSCGCMTSAMKSKSKMKHGMSATSEYNSYKAMVRRCTNPQMRMYPRYGGRGIAVCGRWTGPDGVANFIADMGLKPTPKHTIERLDNDGPYEPGNCVWATRKEQGINRSTTHLIKVGDTTLCQSDWDATKGASLNIVGDRIRRGWNPVDAVQLPVAKYKNDLTHGGKTMSVNAWEDCVGLGHGTIRKRLKLGWSVEKAITEPSRKGPLSRC